MSSKDYRKALDMLDEWKDLVIEGENSVDFTFRFLKQYFDATGPKFNREKFQKYWDTLCKH